MTSFNHQTLAVSELFVCISIIEQALERGAIVCMGAFIASYNRPDAYARKRTLREPYFLV